MTAVEDDLHARMRPDQVRTFELQLGCWVEDLRVRCRISLLWNCSDI